MATTLLAKQPPRLSGLLSSMLRPILQCFICLPRRRAGGRSRAPHRRTPQRRLMAVGGYRSSTPPLRPFLAANSRAAAVMAALHEVEQTFLAMSRAAPRWLLHMPQV